MHIARLGSVVVAGFGLAWAGGASADHDHDRGKREEVVHARLVGYNETPSVSTPAKGNFRAVIDEDAGTITYTLSYEGIGAVAQSHLHLGQHHTAGGIMVFLCTNLGNAPAGTVVQACPTAQPAEISGIITAADVTGNLLTQQIAPGEFAELLAAIRAGAVYVNIHSTPSPAGEIRGQIL
ncbi:MAG: CHRD domain-containing protein [Gammaproteobacteria bacterium]